MIPLPKIVDAVRRQLPGVIPAWLIHEPVHVQNKTFPARWKESYGPCDEGWISDDAARLVVEACLWRYMTIKAREEYNPEHKCASRFVVWNPDKQHWSGHHPFPKGAKVAMLDDTDRTFGDDLCAALAFACGVAVEEEAKGG